MKSRIPNVWMAPKANTYLRRILLLPIFLLLVSHFAKAQSTTNETPPSKPAYNYVNGLTQGYWTFGLNYGFSYQSSDVRATSEGRGFGLTLAKNLYYSPGSLLAFDVRGRLKYANSYGLDVKPSFGVAPNMAINGNDLNQISYLKDSISDGAGGKKAGYYANHRTDMGELGLEAVFTLNRLREQTGIIVQLYGGIGLDWYNVHIDQKDANDVKYKALFKSLDPNDNITTIKTNLKSGLDGTYESFGDGSASGGTVGFMPNLGIELAYQVTPRFQIGFGHKFTFTQTGLFDGQQWDNNNKILSTDDLHHYTSFDMKWIINPVPDVQRAPQIEIYVPEAQPTVTYNPTQMIRAHIRGARSAADVTMTLNNKPINFSYSSGELIADCPLLDGANEVIVGASNEVGRDSKSRTIIYRKRDIPNPNGTQTPNPNLEAPKVVISSPQRNGQTTVQDIITQASITNVNNKDDVSVSFNGVMVPFSYSNGQVRANIRLTEGSNHIIVYGQNASGKGQDDVYVNYTRVDNPPPPPPPTASYPPSVRIYSPENGSESTTASVQLSAQTQYIDNSNQIRIRVNGYDVTDFAFRRDNQSINTRLNLQEGSNTIIITVANNDGSNEARTTVYYRAVAPPPPPPPPPPTNNYPPTVRIVSPADGFASPNPTISMNAVAQFIDNSNQVRVRLNGNDITNFGYRRDNQKITASLNLQEGANTILVTVRNNVGTNEARSTVYYRNARRNDDPPPPPPPPPTPVVRTPKVSIVSPANGSITASSSAALSAVLTNIPSSRNVTVTVNGVNVDNFRMDKSVRNLNAMINLAEGNNTIVVTAFNSDGSDKATTIVTYQKPVVPKPPTVVITSPTSGTVVNTPTTIITAQLTEITDPKKVFVNNNGSSVTDVRLENNNTTVTAVVPLNAGTNVITVLATNNVGTDQKQTTVTYAPEAIKKPPVISIFTPRVLTLDITRPVLDPMNPSSATSVITATVSKVKNMTVTLFINDVEVPTAIYDPATQTLTHSMPALPGKYIIKVVASNGKLSDEKIEEVNF
jgi:large repetitive protein